MRWVLLVAARVLTGFLVLLFVMLLGFELFRCCFVWIAVCVFVDCLFGLFVLIDVFDGFDLVVLSLMFCVGVCCFLGWCFTFELFWRDLLFGCLRCFCLCLHFVDFVGLVTLWLLGCYVVLGLFAWI